MYGVGWVRLQITDVDVQEKKDVDAYKPGIKAQLSRAGLIRDQPRHNPLLVPLPRVRERPHISQQNTSSSNHSRSHGSSLVSIAPSAAYDPYQSLVEPPFVQPTTKRTVQRQLSFD